MAGQGCERWVHKTLANEMKHRWNCSHYDSHLGRESTGKPDRIKDRMGGDSNPRYLLGTHAFQACALDHSATHPCTAVPPFDSGEGRLCGKCGDLQVRCARTGEECRNQNDPAVAQSRERSGGASQHENALWRRLRCLWQPGWPHHNKNRRPSFRPECDSESVF
jgi:hypothetical protein